MGQRGGGGRTSLVGIGQNYDIGINMRDVSFGEVLSVSPDCASDGLQGR